MRYRRKPVEVEAEYDERSGNYILERDASGMASVFWAKEGFEREYEPVPEGPVTVVPHGPWTNKVAGMIDSLKLADELAKAQKALLKYAERNECHHEETHRGGVIWTICDGCGREWADDRGGFEPYEEPAEISEARETLSAYLESRKGER